MRYVSALSGASFPHRLKIGWEEWFDERSNERRHGRDESDDAEPKADDAKIAAVPAVVRSSEIVRQQHSNLRYINTLSHLVPQSRAAHYSSTCRDDEICRYHFG